MCIRWRSSVLCTVYCKTKEEAEKLDKEEQVLIATVKETKTCFRE
ncbi:hypothetical protein OROGR_015003 [Orobanche gracilis]